MLLIVVLVALEFWRFALAVGDGKYSNKFKATDNKWGHNTQRLVLIMVDIIIARIFVMGCSCHGMIQLVTQPVCTRPTRPPF
jgi:hypothetical protein